MIEIVDSYENHRGHDSKTVMLERIPGAFVFYRVKTVEIHGFQHRTEAEAAFRKTIGKRAESYNDKYGI